MDNVILDREVLDYVEKASPDLREALVAIAEQDSQHPALKAVQMLSNADALATLYRVQLIQGSRKRKPGRPRGSRNKKQTVPSGGSSE